MSTLVETEKRLQYTVIFQISYSDPVLSDQALVLDHNRLNTSAVLDYRALPASAHLGGRLSGPRPMSRNHYYSKLVSRLKLLWGAPISNQGELVV